MAEYSMQGMVVFILSGMSKDIEKTMTTNRIG